MTVGSLEIPVVGEEDEGHGGVGLTGGFLHLQRPLSRSLGSGVGDLGGHLPQGGQDGRRAATLGGWQLAVSRYSDNPELAADLVRFLTSQEMQKIRAVEAGFAPTYPELYRDPEVLAANPYFEQLLLCLEGAVAPPSAVAGDRYEGVETAFFSAVHAVLSGDGEAADKLATLEEELARLSRGGRW